MDPGIWGRRARPKFTGSPKTGRRRRRQTPPRAACASIASSTSTRKLRAKRLTQCLTSSLPSGKDPIPSMIARARCRCPPQSAGDQPSRLTSPSTPPASSPSTTSAPRPGPQPRSSCTRSNLSLFAARYLPSPTASSSPFCQVSETKSPNSTAAPSNSSRRSAPPSATPASSRAAFGAPSSSRP